MSGAPPSDHGRNARSTDTGWGLQIATVSGIPVRLHLTLLILLLYISILGANAGSISGLISILTIFLTVLFHELGHSATARSFGIPVANITLYPFGGVTKMVKQPTPHQELWIALAGPAVNIVIALGCWVALHSGVVRAGDATATLLVRVAYTNLFLVAINTIPAFPMDGGRIFRAVLAMNRPLSKATRLATSTGQWIAVVLGVCSLLTQTWLLAIIGLFIFIAAGQEAEQASRTAWNNGISIRDAMVTDIHTLTVGNTLKDATDLLLTTSQHDFPVLHGEEVMGLLTRDALLRGLATEGPGGYVAGAMKRDFTEACPDDDLDETLTRHEGQSGSVVVMEPGLERRLLGLVTGDNVNELFAVRQIAAARNDAQSEIG